MKIDRNKQYRTANGKEVRFYAFDGSADYPIHGATQGNNGQWYTDEWDTDGKSVRCVYDYDLVEVDPYADFKIDDPVEVWDDGDITRTRGHFAGVNSVGYSTIYYGGKTSFTQDRRMG